MQNAEIKLYAQNVLTGWAEFGILKMLRAVENGLISLRGSEYGTAAGIFISDPPQPAADSGHPDHRAGERGGALPLAHGGGSRSAIRGQ